MTAGLGLRCRQELLEMQLALVYYDFEDVAG